MKKFNLNNEIIDIVGNENTDWKSIVLKLAKKDPKTLYAIVKGDDEEDFKLHIYNKYKNSEGKNKVMCVKYIREKYGFGLKEAVNYFDDIIVEYEGVNDTEAQ